MEEFHSSEQQAAVKLPCSVSWHESDEHGSGSDGSQFLPCKRVLDKCGLRHEKMNLEQSKSIGNQKMCEQLAVQRLICEVLHIAFIANKRTVL